MAHVRYTEESDSSEIAAALRAVSTARGQAGRLFRAMANAPQLVFGFERFSETIRKQLPLDFGLFALVTLRTVQLQGDRYEWSRCQTIALNGGIAEGKVADLWSWSSSTLFDAREKAALGIVDEHFKIAVGDLAAAARAKAHLRDEEIVSVCAVMGWFLFIGAITMPLDLVADDPRTDLAVGIEERRSAVSQKEER